MSVREDDSERLEHGVKLRVMILVPVPQMHTNVCDDASVHAGVYERIWVRAVAEAVRLALVRRHADLPSVAEAARMSPEALERRLDASVPFEVSDLERIADALNTDVHDIFDSAELIQEALASKRWSFTAESRRTGTAPSAQDGTEASELNRGTPE